MIDDITLCLDCMALVGANTATEPHLALLTVKDSEGNVVKDSREEEVLGCTGCGVPWTLGPYGWSRWLS